MVGGVKLGNPCERRCAIPKCDRDTVDGIWGRECAIWQRMERMVAEVVGLVRNIGKGEVVGFRDILGGDGDGVSFFTQLAPEDNL